ncbi:MAG: hypothetical protein KDA78_11610 [Planctomycetaceae bacterium]|nr:hypothetical protein [Planctomycetaceae bacterium]
MIHTLRCTILLTVTSLLAGCGSGDSVQLYQYSGTVTFEGQPVVYGQVEFLPDVEKGNDGPRGVAEIIDGKYDTSANGGRGFIGGAAILKITALKQRPPEVADETQEVPPVESICVAFPMEMSLEEKSTTIDLKIPVEADGYNGFKAQASSSRDP